MEKQSAKDPFKEYNIKIYEDETIMEPLTSSPEITILWIHGMQTVAIEDMKLFFKGSSLKNPVIQLTPFPFYLIVCFL